MDSPAISGVPLEVSWNTLNNHLKAFLSSPGPAPAPWAPPSFALLAISLAATLLIASSLGFVPGFRRRGTKAPGPRGWPLLGSMPELLRFGVPFCLDRWFKAYGPVFKFSSGFKETLVVADPDLVRSITLRNFKAFRNRPVLDTLSLQHLQGIVFNRDKHWAAARKAAFPLFHGEQLKTYVPLMSQCIARLSERLFSFAPNQELNIFAVLQHLTLEVFSRAAFGEYLVTKDVVAAAPEAAQIIKASEISIATLSKPTVSSIAAAFVGRSVAAPLKWALGFVPGTAEKMGKDNDAFRKKLVASILNTRAACSKVGKDLVGQLLEFQSKSEATELKLLDSEVVWTMAELILVGSETTANTLSFAVYLLCAHPECEAKLVEEVKREMRTNGPPRDFEDLERFPYAQMVVKETLRVYPVGPVMMREASEEFEFEGPGGRVKKGSTVFIPVLSMQRSEAHFKDAGSFKPERFDPSLPAGINASDSPAYLPFGAGPRMCLGSKFALLEASLALVLLYAKHKFTLAGRLKGLQGAQALAALELGTSMVLKTKEPVLVTVCAREKN